MSTYDMGTAIHEAAHAVTGVRMGFRVYEVYIYPDKSGQTSFGRVNYRDAGQVRFFAISVLAGPVAELLYQGMPTTRDDLADLEGASSDLAKVGAFAQQFDLTGVLEETIAMVKADFPAITKAAQRLYMEGSITGDEIGGMI
jgi:hypothetical protein